MLQRAESNVNAAGVASLVTVTQGDIVDLGFADAAFDVVVARR